MSFKSVKFKDTKINIIDGDRGKNYPSQNEYLEDGYCLFLNAKNCLLYTSPSPRDRQKSRMPSSA